MCRTIMVTGGAGFVGSRLSFELAARGNMVFIVDNLSNSSCDDVPLHKNIHFTHKDVRDSDMDEFISDNNIECIFHLAAVISILESVKYPMATHSNNLDATINLLEAAKKSQRSGKFIFSSSCAVYGQKPDIFIDENEQAEPITPYAIDKYASELYIRYYGMQYGIPYVILRYFNIYGTNKAKITPYSGVIQIFMRNIQDNNDIVIFGSGDQKRDFIHVDDIVKANVLALDSDDMVNDVYNVGSGKSISIKELGDLMKSICSSDVRTVYGPERPGDIKFSGGDMKKIRSFGFTPSIELAEGLKPFFTD